MPSTPGIALHDALHVKFQNLSLDNPAKITISARQGVNPTLFYSFAHFIKMPEKNLARLLNAHPRTIGNYRDQQKNLDPIASEHLLKIIALFIKGERLFGNVDEFNYWLQKPFWNNTDKPIDWLITPGGVDLMYDELDRLAHGYTV